MNKRKLTCAVMFTAMFTSSVVLADEEENYVSEIDNGKVSIEWVKPKEFHDVIPSGHISPRPKYRKFVFNRLHKHFEKLSEKLPEGYALELLVTDLDMAGDTRRNFNNVRVLQRIDIPRMEFSYQLKDANGSIVSNNQVKIKDMNFLDGLSTIQRHRALFYEREMISEWFEKEFKQVINS
ncbi:DUF3016 domain-containing protein [Agaribacter marinus]|uniref:DUF3016 domain-containing protein n=1 Tax=Agaribacter marinus TaxID=1431249 RepID=A0AA37SY56_9ALTE|nr:DUF3016 domain-containing protein [Agaribacter marinus]GLR71197.1 hypothetical protein GCM10007852_21050 [Agaribacter marinus]